MVKRVAFYLKPALDAMSLELIMKKLDSILHQNENNFFNTQTYPPRLLQLIEALEQNQEVDVQLVPVTVLWGRSPDKEDSWFKLLFSILGQHQVLLNNS